MENAPPETTLSKRLGVGFALVMLLMLALTAIAVLRLNEANERMERIVKINNTKTELAHNMKDALRERAVITHTMALMSDPFERDEEFLSFNHHGVNFTTARSQLEVMEHSPEEQAILKRMRDLTLKTQPLVVEAVDLALRGKSVEARKLIGEEIVQAQKQVANEINQFLDLQRTETVNAIVAARDSHQQTLILMVTIGVSAVAIGIVIAFVVIRNARHQAEQLQYQAMFDNLTNLPNRALFADRLQQAILIGRREKQPFGLITMDLDRFKEINDSLGHHVGDQVLQTVAARARLCLRESDTVARMGGDEFSILLATVSDLDGAIAAAKKILHAFDQPLELAGQKIDLGASLGIVMFPEHGEDPAVLMRQADAAMYVAKQSHSGYKVFDKDLGHGADERLLLQSELRHALTNDELVLYYQPKIAFNTQAINGVEALVRWQHPEIGLMPPDKFIPLAEQTGLIKPLTLHVLRTALKQCQEWEKIGLNLSMSVNISAINIQDVDFPGQVEKLLTEYQVNPSRLELEVTETAVMSEPARAVECIKKLSALGLLIAIDDFGTGYSSMSYLKELLVAKIKIDKSFVKDMAVNHNDAVIVRSTVELGHNLGLKVVAEGVETQTVWDRLKELGCDDAQGYHMSKPLPPKKFDEWLQTSQWGLKKHA